MLIPLSGAIAAQTLPGKITASTSRVRQIPITLPTFIVMNLRFRKLLDQNRVAIPATNQANISFIASASINWRFNSNRENKNSDQAAPDSAVLREFEDGQNRC